MMCSFSLPATFSVLERFAFQTAPSAEMNE